MDPICDLIQRIHIHALDHFKQGQTYNSEVVVNNFSSASYTCPLRSRLAICLYPRHQTHGIKDFSGLVTAANLRIIFKIKCGPAWFLIKTLAIGKMLFASLYIGLL